MTVSGDETTPTLSYGVTAGDVRELARHVGDVNPVAVDPEFGETGDGQRVSHISDTIIDTWIARVADSVRSRVIVLAKYSSNTDRWAAITGSARTAVLNGAASYYVAAAYPTKAGTNDSSSYSAELWSRYTEEIAYLSTTLPDAFKDADAEGVVDETGYVGAAPRIAPSPSRIPDSLFFHSPPLYGRAPGAEEGARGSWY